MLEKQSVIERYEMERSRSYFTDASAQSVRPAQTKGQEELIGLRGRMQCYNSLLKGWGRSALFPRPKVRGWVETFQTSLKFSRFLCPSVPQNHGWAGPTSVSILSCSCSCRKVGRRALNLGRTVSKEKKGDMYSDEKRVPGRVAQ